MVSPNASLADLVSAASPEDDILVDAREQAAELGTLALDPAEAAAVTAFTRMLQATDAVIVSAAGGVSAIAVARGMTKGVVTCIDPEVPHQEAARAAFRAADVDGVTQRLITGHALTVVSRLTDGAYDLALVEEPVTDLAFYLDDMARILRPGGALILPGALANGAFAEPTLIRDEPVVAFGDARAAMDLDRTLAASEDWDIARLPLGEGLTLLVRR